MNSEKTLAKRDFGSFFSSNINDLVNMDDSKYSLPIHAVKYDPPERQMRLELGSTLLKHQLFYLTDEFVYLNHGAFGLTLKPVIDYIHKWDIYAESQPLRFYDREVLPLLADIIRMLAKELIKCEPNELVLVENCTYAFNSILNSMVLTRGNKVFIFSTTYGIYKKLLRVKCEQSNAHLIEQNVEFPIRDRESLLNIFVSNLTTLIENDSEIKYIMVDHIPSNIPFVLPVKEMADLCKKMRPDIVFIVDAAHSLGSVNINIRDEFSNVDLLFANCHKWLCGPKGTAIFYKNKNCPVRITPAVQSHGLSDSFVSEFSWSGLRHYTSFLGLYAVLKIWKEELGGFEKAIDYSSHLAKSAGDLLVKAWSTEYLVHPNLCSTFLNVELPEDFILKVLVEKKLEGFDIKDMNYDHAEIVQNFLHFEHAIEVPVKCVQKKLSVRISCHVYNHLSEYQQLADVVLNFSSK